MYSISSLLSLNNNCILSDFCEKINGILQEAQRSFFLAQITMERKKAGDENRLLLWLLRYRF
jgi:hypothetical protein